MLFHSNMYLSKGSKIFIQIGALRSQKHIQEEELIVEFIRIFIQVSPFTRFKLS